MNKPPTLSSRMNTVEEVLNSLKLAIDNLKTCQEKPHNTQNQQFSNVINLSSGNLWIQDYHLDQYFTSFEMEIKNERDDILFCGPSLTRMLKASDSFTCLQVLMELIYEDKSYIFFIINDQDDT